MKNSLAQVPIGIYTNKSLVHARTPPILRFVLAGAIYTLVVSKTSKAISHLAISQRWLMQLT